ncbi:MAG: hypothetical protein ACK55I_21250, partial [bacterium]
EVDVVPRECRDRQCSTAHTAMRACRIVRRQVHAERKHLGQVRGQCGPLGVVQDGAHHAITVHALGHEITVLTRLGVVAIGILGGLEDLADDHGAVRACVLE